MANLPHELMIRFGLASPPTEELAQRWADKTRERINQGIDSEKAGEEIAHELFPDCGTHVYLAQSDTILMLLSRAEER